MTTIVTLPAPHASARLTLGVREAAAMLGVSERHLHTLTQRGDVPHVRLGGRVVYRIATLDRWLTEREQTAGAK